MAMNPSEPKPCEPLAADGDRRREPAAPRDALYCYSPSTTRVVKSNAIYRSTENKNVPVVWKWHFYLYLPLFHHSFSSFTL